MTVQEWWWLYGDRRPRKRYGSLTEDQVEELYEDLMEAQAKARRKGNG